MSGSGQSCQQCPALREEIAVLRSQIIALGEHIRHLRGQFNGLIVGVDTTLAMIVREQEEPTMTRGQLVQAIGERLQYLVDLATKERL